MRAWQDQAPAVLQHAVQWTLEIQPGFLLPPMAQPEGVRREGAHILELSVWARRMEVALVPEAETQPHRVAGWAAMNQLLQGVPGWL